MAEISGGDKLATALAEIAAKLTKAATLRVGFLEGATYPDGTPVAMIAAIHNYGAPAAGVPPRPFFTDMIAAKSPEWGPAIGALLPQNDYDTEKVLEVTGHAIAGQLKQEITTFVGVPLSQRTIDRKGFDKQLVDRGIMLNSVDFEVNT